MSSSSATTDIREQAAASGRDLVIDLTRVACIVAVVALHSLMIGLSLVDGAIVQVNPMETQRWFPLASWAGQIMPLFFVVGGFAGLLSWRSAQARGTSWAMFLRNRLERVLRPTLVMLLFVTAVLVVALLLGTGRGVVDMVAFAVGMPLWFLAAFIICQATTPLLVRYYERSRWATMIVLVAAVIAVDAIRMGTGVAEIGLLNLFFLWSAVQLLGFFLADGRFALHPLRLMGIAVLSYGLVALMTLVVPVYPVNMLVNLNPATLPLLLLGIAQTALLRLLHPLLTRMTRSRAVLATTFLIGSRAMTIYLWHLPVVIAVGGAAFLLGIDRTVPGSEGWWLSRPLFFAMVVAVVVGISQWARRWERGPAALRAGQSAPSTPGIALAAALALAVFIAEIQWGFSVVLLGITAAAVWVSLLLLAPRRAR